MLKVDRYWDGEEVVGLVMVGRDEPMVGHMNYFLGHSGVMNHTIFVLDSIALHFTHCQSQNR